MFAFSVGWLTLVIIIIMFANLNFTRGKPMCSKHCECEDCDGKYLSYTSYDQEEVDQGKPSWVYSA